MDPILAMFPNFIIFVAVIAIALAGIISLFSGAKDKSQQKKKRKSIDKQRQDQLKKEQQIWDEADSISDLVEAYIQYVVEHGPKSQEAKTFRMAVQNEKLHGHHASLSAFQRQADLADKICALKDQRESGYA